MQSGEHRTLCSASNHHVLLKAPGTLRFWTYPWCGAMVSLMDFSAFFGNAQERRVVMAQGNHSGKHWLEWSNLLEHQLEMCLCWCNLGQATCLCHEITARNSCNLQSHHPQLWHLQCIPQGSTMLQETSSIELLVLRNCRVAYNLEYQRIEQCIQL
jgi:hypothetical protein